MRVNRIRAFIAITILSILVSYNACSRSTSQTSPSTQGTIVPNPLAPVSSMLSTAVCRVVSRCHPEITFESCNAGLLKTSGLGVPLGLPTALNRLSDIIEAEQDGNLVGNSSIGETCSTSITDISCDDSRAMGAYNATLSDPLSGTPNLISAASCSGALVVATQYTCSRKVFLRGSSNSDNTPVLTPSGATYSISPTLPPGLSLSASTGVISGTPTTLTPLTTYTVTISGPAGVSSTQIHIKTADGYRIDDLSNANDADPTDGRCLTAGGTCTLKAALAQAAQSRASLQTDILLASGTLMLNTALNLQSDVNIWGDCSDGTILDGQSNDNIFDAAADGLTISMESLKLQNGMSDAGGGAISSGPYTNLKFTGTRLTFYKNTSTNLAAGGGAIMWSGGASSFFCNECTFENNHATHNGGALLVAGPAVSLQQCLFTNNTAEIGGAIFSTGTNDRYENSTFYANNAIAVYLNNAGATFINDTFVNNTDTSSFAAGAIASNNNASATFSNTLLYNNSAPRGNCSVTVISNGGNLVFPISPYCIFNDATDLVVDPLIGPLQDNGGVSRTIPIMSNSPAIRAGRPSYCPAVDQRGRPRLINGTCDIGAYESP